MSWQAPQPLLRKHRVADRVRILEGSFFDAVPEGGDLYVLKNIIHDWPDDKAQQILKTLRVATRDRRNRSAGRVRDTAA